MRSESSPTTSHSPSSSAHQSAPQASTHASRRRPVTGSPIHGSGPSSPMSWLPGIGPPRDTQAVETGAGEGAVVGVVGIIEREVAGSDHEIGWVVVDGWRGARRSWRRRSRGARSGACPRAGRRGSASAQALDDHRHALPAADAHRLEAPRLAGVLEAVEQRGHDPRAGHPERVAERDRRRRWG